MNHKLVHFTQSSIICGFLFSGLFFSTPSETTASMPNIVLLADNSTVKPVNPLNPAITVDPIDAPPESTDAIKHIQPSKEFENVHPTTLRKTKSIKRKPKGKKAPLKKQSALKITQLTPYSFETDAVLPSNPGNSGGNNDYHYTNTGQLLANLSGFILYGTKK